MSKKYIIITILIFILQMGCVSPRNIKWSQVEGPTINSSNVYGSYSAGCLAGAVSLAASSENYQVMRVARKRYYGHPSLIHFLENYAAQVYAKNYGTLIIGDLSQARGGPMPGGHASHQVGLDADIWFKRFSASERNNLSLDDVESMSADSMLNQSMGSINNDTWTEENAAVLQMAASDKEVERIFVNFVIKKTLCEKYRGEAWLGKIRPWWGHEYHYHIRLNCPEGSLTCQSQAPVLQADGCDETLDWWFSEEAQKELDKKFSRDAKEIKLPHQCDLVLEER